MSTIASSPGSLCLFKVESYAAFENLLVELDIEAREDCEAVSMRFTCNDFEVVFEGALADAII